MRLPDGTILMHGRTPYDPAKAHEYYLRTRKLKGRKKGSTYTVNLGSGKTVQLSEQQLVEQRAYAAKRVADIKQRLGQLKVGLRKMMAAANNADKKPTAADKSKAARESRKYRDKHKQELATKRKTSSRKTEKPKSSAVEDTKKAIIKIENNLRTAVAKQRALAAATKN